MPSNFPEIDTLHIKWEKFHTQTQEEAGFQELSVEDAYLAWRMGLKAFMELRELDERF